MRLLRPAVGAVVLLLAVTSCGDGGKVTEADYLNAVQAFTDCLSEHGIEAQNQGWDPVNRLAVSISYAVDGERGVPDPQGQKCEDEHLTDIGEAYADQATPAMADDLRTYTRTCLTAKGHDIAATVTNLGGFLEHAQEDVVNSCVTSGLAILYPDVPAMIGSR
ncbi:hypothetical protein EV651_11795 [Kribbella sp. VKM Ac-2571]|uniref:hypothetical protein n=1 Tax=Kribbella sp. VKM Ac-2571 TaxID=2512222 RepID=UPI0010606F3A|nr:hypothetical protein [Kribbella sp. VKM Ac-2571]TDO52905.1 hypothetical protein EV651_11795 [Kribbella sp. VKM Ac-2571]